MNSVPPTDLSFGPSQPRCASASLSGFCAPYAAVDQGTNQPFLDNVPHALAARYRSSFIRGDSHCRGFSLVEVVTALGIVAFVVIALVGLMSSGLDSFNSALDQSIRSQIAQRLVTEVQQSDLEELLLQPETLRYFDQEGTEAENVEQSIYTARLEVKPETQLPKTTKSLNLLTVSIKIAQDPGRHPDPFGPESRLNITEHTAFIARAE